MSKITASSRTKAHVIDVLNNVFLSNGTNPTTTELAQLIGRTPTTVRHVLLELGATPIDDSRPTRWTFTGHSDSVMRRVVSKNDDEIQFQVGWVDAGNSMSRWNDQAGSVAKLITDTRIEPSVDPKELGRKLANVAGAIASVAYEVQQVQDKPDWYDILTESEVS